MKFKLPIILLLPLIGIFSVKAYAQETLRSFTITPPGIEVNLNPGERSEGKLKLVNDGSTPLTFKVTTQDFIVEDSEGTPKILPPNTLSNKYSGANWVAIYPSTVTIAPHTRAELNYFIQIPSDAPAGGHYAAAVYTPTSALDVNGTGAAVNTSIGTLFYLTVKGDITISAKINKFLTKNFWEWGPVNLQGEIQNLSDTHIRPQGNISLYNMLGGKSDVVKLPEQNIFPGVSRSYDVKAGKGLMLGRYKAVLEATYGANKAPLMASAYFIVFPWRIAAFLILLAVAIIAGYWYWKKDKSIKEATKENEVNNQASSNDA